MRSAATGNRGFALDWIMRRFSSSHDWCSTLLFHLATVLAAGTLAGCNSAPTEQAKVAVDGKVLHDNRGVPLVLVFFYGAGDARVAEAATDKDGSFSLSCPPGTYRIALRAVPAGAGQSPGGGSADPSFLIQAPDQKGLKQIPKNYLNPASSGVTVEIPDGGKNDVKIVIK
jgi:hypothetical protein